MVLEITAIVISLVSLFAALYQSYGLKKHLIIKYMRALYPIRWKSIVFL